MTEAVVDRSISRSSSSLSSSFRQQTELLKELVIAELRFRYSGTLMGQAWLIAQPLITVAVMWAVFTIGLKPPMAGETHLVSWLLAGMLPWFMITDGLLQGANSFVEKPHLIKKMVFNFSILVAVKCLASLTTQLIMIPVLFLAMAVSGVEFTVHLVQLPLFILFALFLIYSVSLLTSTLNVFSRDVGNFMAVIIQLGFWATPIIWKPGERTAKFPSWLFDFNPAAFIVDGFRAATVEHRWFIEHPSKCVAFAVISGAFFVIGKFTLSALKNEFADVL